MICICSSKNQKRNNYLTFFKIHNQFFIFFIICLPTVIIFFFFFHYNYRVWIWFWGWGLLWVIHSGADFLLNTIFHMCILYLSKINFASLMVECVNTLGQLPSSIIFWYYFFNIRFISIISHYSSLSPHSHLFIVLIYLFINFFIQIILFSSFELSTTVWGCVNFLFFTFECFMWTV